MSAKVKDFEIVTPDKTYLSELSEVSKFVQEQIINAAGGLPLPKYSNQNPLEKHVLKIDGDIRKSYHGASDDATQEITMEFLKAERSQQAVLEDALSNKELAIISLGDNLYRIKKLRRDFRRAEAAIKAREVTIGRPIKDEVFHKRYILALFGAESLMTCLRAFFSDYEMGLGGAISAGLGTPFGNMVLIAGIAYALYRTKWSQTVRLTVISTCTTLFVAVNAYVATIFADFGNPISILGSAAYFLSISGLMALWFADLKRVWNVSEEDRELLRQRDKAKNEFTSFKATLEKQFSQLKKGFFESLSKISQNHLVLKEDLKVKTLQYKQQIAQLNNYLSKLTDTIEELVNDSRVNVRETVKDANPEFEVPAYYYEDFKMDPEITQEKLSDASIDEKIVEFDAKIAEFDQRISQEKQLLTQEVKNMISEVNAISHDMDQSASTEPQQASLLTGGAA